MRFNKTISILLSMVMAVGLITGCGGTDTALAAGFDAELTKAIDTGIMPETWLADLKKPVTIGEFNQAITKIVAMCNPDFVPKWEKAAAQALKRTDVAQRDDAILSIFEAAIIMGIDKESALCENTEDWESKSPAEDWWEGRSWDYDYFPNWDTVYEHEQYDEDYNVQMHSAWYVERRLSTVSQKHIFEPTEKWTFGFDRNVSREEAARALLRWMESSFSITYGLGSGVEKVRVIGLEDQAVYAGISQEEITAIRNAAKERKQAIINSPTTIVKADQYVMGESYSGTAYYVSNNGSDRNNGRSPEKPFATMKPFEKIELKYGDAVFFERGSLWRATELHWGIRGKQGITLSAYGEGPKPAFYGSSENGTGTEKWKLHYSDGSGKKIWKFYREMTEVASIVLNENEVVHRDIAYWDGKSYFQINEKLDALTGNAYAIEKYLPDMWCFPAIRYPDAVMQNHERLFKSWDEHGKAIYYTGPLYFRCDAGNPGEIYQDIEFIQPMSFCDGMSDYQTYDNLCIKYSSGNFTTGYNGIKEACNGVVQNCEIGWMGGHVIAFASGAGDVDERWELNYSGLFGRNSGALSINGSGYTLRNNYVHDAYQEGISMETFPDCDSMVNNTVIGNLVERATQGILICNWDTVVNENHIFKNILVEDNIVLDSGINNFFSSDWENDYANAILIQGGPCAHEGMVIKNNIFAFATGALVMIDEHSETYSKAFEGNTYAQFAGDDDAIPENGISIHQEVFQPLTKEIVAKLLGDKTGTVY